MPDKTPDPGLDVPSNPETRTQQHMLHAAMIVSGHCMMPALAEIALDVLGQGGAKRFGDVVLNAIEGLSPASIDILLTKDQQPGAYHLRIQGASELNAEGQERLAEERCRMAHLPYIERIFAEMDDPSIQDIRMDKSLHMPLSRTMQVKRMAATALSLDRVLGVALSGAPAGLSRSATQRIEDYWPERSSPCIQHLEARWQGLVLDQGSLDGALVERLVMEVTSARNSSFSGPTLLCMLGSIVEEAGLEHLAEARLGEIMEQPRELVGGDPLQIPIDMGIAAVRRSGGLFSEETMHRAEHLALSQADMQSADFEVFPG